MHDLATPQGRIAWTRERLLRMSADEVVRALSALPDPVRYDRPAYNVSRYETGARPVPLDYYRALSELSGVSLDWLIEGRAPRGTAVDALRRVRHALDQIEEQYLSGPDDRPLSVFRRADDDDHSGGSS